MPNLTVEQAIAEVINKITGDAVNVVSSANLTSAMVSTPITRSTSNTIDFGTYDAPTIYYPWATSFSTIETFAFASIGRLQAGSYVTGKLLLNDATIINRASGILAFSNWGKVFRPISNIVVQNVTDVYYIQPSFRFSKVIHDGTSYYYDQQAIIVEYIDKANAFLQFKVAEGVWSGSKFIVSALRDATSTDLIVCSMDNVSFTALGAYVYAGAGRTIFSEDVTTTSIRIDGRTTNNERDRFIDASSNTFRGRFLWMNDFATNVYVEFVCCGLATHSNTKTFVLGIAHSGSKYSGTSSSYNVFNNYF